MAATHPLRRDPPLSLRTDRLDLLPLSRLMIRTLLDGEVEGLERLVGGRAADGWPSESLLLVLPKYVRRLETDPGSIGWGHWLMIERKSGTIVGTVGFKARPDENGMVDIGYAVAPAHRGSGYAAEGARVLINWAFATPEVTRIIASCHEENTPSIRVLEKLGMRYVEPREGLLYWELLRPAD